MRRTRPLIGCLVPLAVLLAACGSADPQPVDSGAAAVTTPTATAAATPGASATATETGTPTAATSAASVPAKLRFSATTTDGQPFDAASLAGKDAVLWFWAAWCTVCQSEAPAVAAVQAANAGKVTFLGVPGLGPVGDMRGFVDRFDLAAFPHLVDADGSLWQRFDVTAQPAHAFIDDSGEIEVVRGSLSRDQLEEKVAELTAR